MLEVSHPHLPVRVLANAGCRVSQTCRLCSDAHNHVGESELQERVAEESWQRIQTPPPPPSRYGPPQLPAPDARLPSTPLAFPSLDHHHSIPDDAERGRTARGLRSTLPAADTELGSGSHASTRAHHPRSARREHMSDDADTRGQDGRSDGGLASKVSYPELHCNAVSGMCAHHLD